LFYELMRRRGPFCFFAFDLLWLDGSDLRERPYGLTFGQLRRLISAGRNPPVVVHAGQRRPVLDSHSQSISAWQTTCSDRFGIKEVLRNEACGGE
jgi:ATP-dependent DNA ligase